MSRIGFIGAGIMGAPMIANLVSNGHDVAAYARSERSASRAEQAGASLTADIAGCVRDAEFVITMLPDSPDVEAVALGADGVLTSIADGALFIDMSTISAGVTRAVHEAAGERGVAALDAPVSGGEAAAIEGTLSVMVGGDKVALETARPVLSCMSATVTHVGGPGAGQLTKAANQLIVATNIQAVAEAVVLLDSSGIDVRAALEAISTGLAGSTVLTRKMDNFLNRDFEPGFRVELHHKDLSIVQTEALANHLSLPISSLVAQLMAALNARGDGGLDHSALLKLTEDLNGN